MINKEIEIKIEIEEADFAKLQAWLDQNAKFEENKHQVDVYFDHPKLKFAYLNKEGLKDAYEYLRVRRTGKDASICLKHFHEDVKGSGIHSHCDEYETDVEDGTTAIELLKTLGYFESCTIDKNRKEYHYKNLEIEIDDVKDLGIFVEVELKEQVTDVKAGKEIIYDFLREVGITTFKLQQRGYVSMLWNPDHNFGDRMEI